MSREILHPAIADLVSAPRPADEVARRVNAPLDPAEVAEVLDLVRWFTTRYPTPRDRLRYMRRKVREWTRKHGPPLPPRG